MRTTFDAEADAAYIQLVPEITPGRSVRNEIVETAGGTVVLDIDHAGVLLGVEVLGAEKLLDGEFPRRRRVDRSAVAMPETVRLVLSRNSEQPYVLHREDCPTVQHQVRGDLREELPAGGSQILETYEGELALIGPNEGTERWYYDAVYVTLEELATLGRKGSVSAQRRGARVSEPLFFVRREPSASCPRLPSELGCSGDAVR